MLLQCMALVLTAVAAVTAQGGPPGVPPRQQQQFQQQPPVPQQQQQQQFQQQPPVQQQQQQQQQHQQQQQQHQQQQQQHQPQGGHGHAAGHGGGLKFQSEIHNADHIIEHLQDTIKTKPKDQMSEEELEFHYFKMHDYDNNNKLDGVEIGKALTHFHDDDQDNHNKNRRRDKKVHDTPQMPDDDLEEMLAEVMVEEDTNEDGYIDYVEFRAAQSARKQEGEGVDKPYSVDRFE